MFEKLESIADRVLTSPLTILLGLGSLFLCLLSVMAVFFLKACKCI